MIRQKILKSLEASANNLPQGTYTHKGLHMELVGTTEHTLRVDDLPGEMVVVHDIDPVIGERSSRTIGLEKQLGKIARITYNKTQEQHKGMPSETTIKPSSFEGEASKLSRRQLARVAISLKRASRIAKHGNKQ